MALKDIASGRRDVFNIDPNLLKIKEGWNNRDFNDPANAEHVEQLARSIAEIGVREPLKVVWEDNTPYITNGECRYRATLLAIKNGAEIKTVPVMSEDRYANEGDRIFTQIASNSGKPFTQLEMAKTFKKLLDLGWKQQEIAAKAGMSGGRVSQILEYLTLPTQVQQMVTNGEVSASMAVKVVKEEGSQATEKLSQAVSTAKAEGKSKAAPKHVEGAATRGPSAVKVVKDAIEQAMSDSRFDESEDMVTVSFTEGEWTRILQALKM